MSSVDKAYDLVMRTIFKFLGDIRDIELNETHEFKGTRSELFERARQTLAKGEALVKVIRATKEEGAA